MAKETVIPQLGALLRSLIKAAGYRSHINELGMDKDLDDLALDADGRQGSATERLQKIEDACCLALSIDCGNDWAQFFRQAWFSTRETVQFLAQHADTSPLPQEPGQKIFTHCFTVPMLSGFLRHCLSGRQGPDADLWWNNPFQAWLDFAANKATLSQEKLLTNLANHLDADPRTIARWLSGEPIGRIGWPYRLHVEQVLGGQNHHQIDERTVLLLTGWLLLAVVFQSLPLDVRDASRRDLSLRSQNPWSRDGAVAEMTRQGFDLGRTHLRDAAVPLLYDIQQLFASNPLDDGAVQNKLNTLQGVIMAESPDLQRAYQYIHDWFAARLVALQGKQEAALGLYAAAVSGAWWFAGGNQQPIIREALLYAVGVGAKADAEKYWDKTFMLGLNHGPKRILDEQEMRRIAFGFEKQFFPQKAKDRVPPTREILASGNITFSLDRQHLVNPNRLAKFAAGRTRRTPLMEAVNQGTLDDVKRLIDAGGDPNDFVKESGEGPLSYAMRRACDRGDPIIMEFLLELDLQPETVNRPASTKRETPLKIAIEMADSATVSRLIELGASVENVCDSRPSALWCAMQLFNRSLHRHDPTQELAYLSGKTRADVYDAKDGAVLDVELAVRRQHLHAELYATDRRCRIMSALKDIMIRPADDHRRVIQALMHAGADANRRYRIGQHHLAEWTPTLFAAEVGDLDVFKILVESPGSTRGNPALTLVPSSSLEKFDALWVAIAHGRHAIVSYLFQKNSRMATD